VELTFEHPPGFSTDGTGYVLVCLPWIAKNEWHAYSLFSHPTRPGHSCVCMAVGGDWTKKLHNLLERPTHRPAWVSGPFASPYATAVEYDNLVLVASGIGITPAMSIITTYKETRRANLIWVCRDASLLEFYLDKCNFDDDGWTLVFYTGKRKLQLPRQLAPTVLIFHGRPDLPHVVREIILGVESGNGLPEDLLVDAEALEVASIARKIGWQSLPVDARFQALVHLSLVNCGEDGLRKRIDDYLRATAPTTGNTARCAPQLSAVAFHGLVEDFFAPVIEEGKQAFLPTEVPQMIASVVRSSANGVGDSSGGGDDCDDSGGGKGDVTAPTCGVADVARMIHRVIDAEMLSSRQSRASAAAAEDAKKRMTSTFGAPATSKKRRTRISELDRSTSGWSRRPEEFLNQVSSEQLGTWQMLYCGGSQPVVEALASVQREYGIKLRVEKFDW